MADETDNKTLIRKAYGAATTRLRDNHRAEFNDLMKKEAENLGVEWSPRPSADERAEQELLDLLAKNPALAAKYEKVREPDEM